MKLQVLVVVVDFPVVILAIYCESTHIVFAVWVDAVVEIRVR